MAQSSIKSWQKWSIYFFKISSFNPLFDRTSLPAWKTSNWFTV
ncbi:hypothetical protein LRHK_152 [Lacticaseibacillus rhamnosus ATCC 8530]|nr:hypothetical protein LRHK_152 [Lacticaseibacillus rhamnosus ATCC 8530]